MSGARKRLERKLRTYEVDSAMLGEDWIGDLDGLRLFCWHLQKIVGAAIKVEPVTDSHDGAYNLDPQLVSERDWQAAVEACPDTFWRTSAPWATCDVCDRHVESDMIAHMEEGAPRACGRCGFDLPDPPADWLVAHGYNQPGGQP